MTAVHNPALLAQQRATRSAAMRQAFGAMLRNSASVQALGRTVHGAVARMHEANIESFGWLEAETLRSHAFALAQADADAAEARGLIPVGEATESDFGTFQNSLPADASPAT